MSARRAEPPAPATGPSAASPTAAPARHRSTDARESDREAAEQLAALRQMVSGVEHELHNALAAIVAFSQLVRQDDRLPDDLRNDADLLVKEAERTRRLVLDLLAMARPRPAAGQERERRQPRG